jgi:hypothetical protein
VTILRRNFKLPSILICLFLASTANADELDRIPEMIMSMPSRSTSGLIELRSDAEMDFGATARQIEQAYEFDRNLQNWGRLTALDRKVIVGLATEDTISRFMHSNMGGRAVGSDMFASHANLYNERADLAYSVTAHELEHILMTRLGAREPAIPVYIFEGIACSVGARYAVSAFGKSRDLVNERNRLAQISAADAKEVIENFRQPGAIAQFKQTGKLWIGEHIGGLFIEHLLTNTGSSPADFFRKFGLLVLDVSNKKSFADAFAGQFGISLEEAERQFISFMEASQRDSSMRFRGTIYE